MEEEIKLRVADHAPVRERLRSRGARLAVGEQFERNWVLDDDGARLATGGCLLRVRRWGERSSLTFKGPPSFVGGVKRREEVESDVADPSAILGILAGLGFVVRRRYEKRRETWTVGDAEVALDTTPMGLFVEIEGPADALPALARDLGLDPAGALRGSYVALWEAYRADHPETGDDMVFT